MFMYRFAGQRKALLVGGAVGALLALSLVAVFAQGPLPRTPRSPQAALGTGFTYQGQLKNGAGAVNGQCDLAFRLYDDPSAGSQVGNGITQTIPITGGLFTTRLNTGGEFGGNAFNGDARWLEIAVSTTCPAGGGFTTLSPRQPLSAVPYALFSAAPWVTSGGNLYYNTGNVGIGTTAPQVTTHLYGPSTQGQNLQLRIESSNQFHSGNLQDTDAALLIKDSGAGTIGFFPNYTDGRSVIVLGQITRDGAVDFYNWRDFGGTNTYDLQVRTKGSASSAVERFRITGNADTANVYFINSNVGIGTTASTDRLAVAGVVSTTGGVRFPDNTLQTTALTRPQNVKVVARSGGDYSTIGAALTSITDASATNHYLIYVSPGTYTESVTMKPYVDMEGAGELTTKVTFTGSASANTGTVLGASNAELRFLTVENTGGNAYAIGVYNTSASPRLTHMTASAQGASNSDYGVYNDSAAPAMTNVTANASGGSGNNFGVYDFSATPTINYSTLSGSDGAASFGIANFAFGGSYTVTINNSQVSGSTNTIYNNPSFTTRVGTSQLSGGAVTGGGTLICVFSYSAGYVALNSTCQ